MSGAEYLKVRDRYFLEHGWELKQCEACSGFYYTKKNLRNCGSFECVEDYAFLENPSPNKYLDWQGFVVKTGGFLQSRGYRRESPIKVQRLGERTLFASTAGQIYDGFIYGGGPRECIARVVIQPVVRLQEANLLKSRDGLSTSFAHVAIETWNADPDDHFRALDSWLDMLSELGLYVGKLCLKVGHQRNDWLGHSVDTEMLGINYQGLDLGTTNFFSGISQTGGLTATLSEVGGSIERMVWGVNRSPFYFDGIAPVMYLDRSRVLIDSVRTATLMVGSGVTPGHKNHGSKLRSLVNAFAGSVRGINLYELIEHFHSQWLTLIALEVPPDGVYRIIMDEVNRSRNLSLSQRIRMSGVTHQSTENALRFLLNEGHLSMTDLYELMDNGN